MINLYQTIVVENPARLAGGQHFWFYQVAWTTNQIIIGEIFPLLRFNLRIVHPENLHRTSSNHHWACLKIWIPQQPNIHPKVYHGFFMDFPHFMAVNWGSTTPSPRQLARHSGQDPERSCQERLILEVYREPLQKGFGISCGDCF